VHELSLMAGMMEIIQGEARAQGFGRVTRVGLEIGRFAGVEPEALSFAFQVCTRDSVAEGAELVIEPAEGVGRCLDCGRESPVASYLDRCGHCQGERLRIVSGKQMRVKYLDVD